jgi:hypothetical protein
MRKRIPPRSRSREAVPSLFGFAPGGVCLASSVASAAVRSYRTLSPLLYLSLSRSALLETPNAMA